MDGSRGVAVSQREVCGISADGVATCAELESPSQRRIVGDHAVALTADAGVTCLVDTNRQVSCWGVDDSLFYENAGLPNGYLLGRDHPRRWRGTPIPVQTDVVSFAQGWGHRCWTELAGATWCAGASAWGESGESDEGAASEIAVEQARELAVGPGFSCAIVPSGVWCWGDLELRCRRQCVQGDARREVAACRDPSPRLLLPSPSDRAGVEFHSLAVSAAAVCAIADGVPVCARIRLAGQGMFRLGGDVVAVQPIGSPRGDGVCTLGRDDRVVCTGDFAEWMVRAGAVSGTDDTVTFSPP